MCVVVGKAVHTAVGRFQTWKPVFSEKGLTYIMYMTRKGGFLGLDWM